MCPSCGAAAGDADDRFCPDCGLPLVHPGGSVEPVSEAHERARKVRPQYSEGPLVRVAFARHQAEAELIQGLLLEEGVPSIVKRSRGFDVPDFLASGPRDIFVPASGADIAHDLLAATPPTTPRPAARRWVQLLALALAVLLLALSAAGVVAALL